MKGRHEPHELFEFLFIALLSVNQYPLELTWVSRDELRSAHLFDPAYLATAPLTDLVQGLKAAHLDRGEFMTNLFASRLQTVGQFIIERGEQWMRDQLESLERGELEALLLNAKGIGPRVVDNFLLLRDTG